MTTILAYAQAERRRRAGLDAEQILHHLWRSEPQAPVGSDALMQRLEIDLPRLLCDDQEERPFLSLSRRFLVKVPLIWPRKARPSSTVLCSG
jgi:hypothetical protein